jgi:hypothetical protein
MKKYQDILSSTVSAYFRFNYYKIFSLWLRIIVLIILIPIHLFFIASVVFYAIVYFIITMTRVPAEFIRLTIDENKDHHPATQVIVYLVSYPYKFLFDFFTALQLTLLAWIFFFMQVSGYVGSLGNLVFQPFLMHATRDVSKPKTTFHFSRKQELIVLLGVIGIVVIFGIIGVINTIIEKDKQYDDYANVAHFVLETQNMTDDFVIIEAYYNESINLFVFTIRSNSSTAFWTYNNGVVARVYSDLYTIYTVDAIKLNQNTIQNKVNKLISS